MATIMDGKALSLKLKEQMKQRIAQLKQQGINPKLVVVLVGDNSASQVYVRNKHKSCGEVGIESEVITMPEQTTQQELLEGVDFSVNVISKSGRMKRWTESWYSCRCQSRLTKRRFCARFCRKRMWTASIRSTLDF